MTDHLVELIKAAIIVAEQVEIKSAFPLEDHEQTALKKLKSAVAEYKKVNKESVQ